MQCKSAVVVTLFIPTEAVMPDFCLNNIKQDPEKMETPNAAKEHIEKWLDYIEGTHHEHLEDIMSDLDNELSEINKNRKDRDLPLLKDFTASFHEVKKEVHAAIDKERSDVFRRIRHAIDNMEDETARDAFRSLSDPVRKVIMAHHRILDKIHNLLPKITALGYNGLTKDEHLKMYTDMFGFYNSYDKLVYIEENMIFPAIVAAFEKKEEWHG